MEKQRITLRQLLVAPIAAMARDEHIRDLPNPKIRYLEAPKKSENIAKIFFVKKSVFSAKKNIANTSFPAYNLGMGVLGTPQHSLFS